MKRRSIGVFKSNPEKKLAKYIMAKNNKGIIIETIKRYKTKYFMF